MRRYLALITNLALILVFVCSAFAKPVGMDDAIKVGRTHLQAQEQSWKGKASSAPGKFSGSILDIRKLNASGKTLAYILDLSPEGCIVVSPDTDICPVIAYSSEGRFSMDDTQDNVLLRLVRQDIGNRLEALAITPKEMKDSNNILWSKYLVREEEFIQQLSSAETWGPWLKTAWHQFPPYNKYCPRICPENCPVGCAATAMAQIIYYWEYPRSVTFNNEDRYVTKKENIRIDEDSVLSFDQLNLILSDIKYDGNEDEVAALCLACGISVEMNYTCNGSGAIPNAQVYKGKFKYASAVDISDLYDVVGFYNILEENMKNGQPAQLAVSSKKDDGTIVSHSLVADGFRYPGEYHLNFGGGPIDECWYSPPFPPIPDVPPLSNEMRKQSDIFDYGVVNILPQYDNPLGVYFRGNSYKVVSQSMSWRNAKSYAESLGGHLVTISDEAENRFVTDLAMENDVLRFWIGLTDEAEEGHFVWVTGEPLTYTKWLTGEPNDYGGAEDYAEIGFGIPYFWNDNNSSWSQPFVVEFEGVASTFRGNSYTVINQSMSWRDARLYAESLDGHLVTIGDDEENRFVADLARVKGIRRSFWIGLTDEAKEGRFAWVTNEPLTYENWYPGEPNNYGGDEDFVEIGFYDPYSWNDNGDKQTNPFVIEFEGQSIPTSAVLVLFDENIASEAGKGNFAGLFNSEGGSKITVTQADAYTGMSSVFVTPTQCYNPGITGWKFPIKEKPKTGEYRYIRFAWKADGGTGVMIQFANNGYWGVVTTPCVNPPAKGVYRYVAGQNVISCSGICLSDKNPTNWAVVERDLFADFGEFIITGMALTPFPDGGKGDYFDTIILSSKPLAPVPTGRNLVIPEVSGTPGQDVTVPINIADATGVAGCDITLSYDANFLKVKEVKSTTLSSRLNMVANTNTTGKIILRMAGTNAITSGSGALIDIIFTVNVNAKVGIETPVSFEIAEAFDENGLNIIISIQNGKVKITAVCAKGDVNDDGFIKSNDAILALLISAELMTPTPRQFCSADVNNDNKVGADDVILILKKAAGLVAPAIETITDSGRNISVTLDEVYGRTGEIVTIPLRVNNPDILAGGDLCITYDSSVLRAAGVVSGNGTLLAANLAEPKIVRIAFASADRLDGEIVAGIRFDVLAEETSMLAFQSVELYTFDGTPLIPTGIDRRFIFSRPRQSALLQNFPNPFNPETWIPYQLAEDSPVTIRIYSSTGQLIKTIVLGYKRAGAYVTKDATAYWDGRNEAGEYAASGVYFYSIQAGDFVATKKMTVLE